MYYILMLLQVYIDGSECRKSPIVRAQPYHRGNDGSIIIVMCTYVYYTLYILYHAYIHAYTYPVLYVYICL